jgi:hypothetical protein
MLALEFAFSFRFIENLVFIEYPSLFYIEVIPVSMAMGGIFFSRKNNLLTHSTDRKSPEGIPGISYKVFTGLHGISSIS